MIQVHESTDPDVVAQEIAELDAMADAAQSEKEQDFKVSVF